jgi:hypothetical protein
MNSPVDVVSRWRQGVERWAGRGADSAQFPASRSVRAVDRPGTGLALLLGSRPRRVTDPGGRAGGRKAMPLILWLLGVPLGLIVILWLIGIV